MRTIRKISVLSAMKISAVLAALLFAIIGGILLIFQLLFGSILAVGAGGQEGAGAFGAIAGLGIVGYIVGIVVYAIFGAIGGALNAFFYNIVAGMVGGLEIELE